MALAAPDSRSEARAAGLFYLATIVTGLYAEIATRSMLTVRDDAETTARTILAQAALFRSGLAADIVMLGCYIVVTALLYRLFRRADARLSLVAMLFSLTGITMLAATSLLHAAVPVLLEQPDGAGPALLALRLHGRGYGISLAFFGAYCLLTGWLAIRSRLLPVPVGGLMMLGGAEHLTRIFGGMLVPDLVAMLPAAARYLPLLGEACFASWLTIFAVRRSAPHAAALLPY